MVGSKSNSVYHLCPNTYIAPPPKGHLQLGSIITGLGVVGVESPLNIDHEVSVPDDDLYPRDEPTEKTGFSYSLRDIRSKQASIWAKIFGWDGLGGPFAFLRSRDDDETLTVDKLFERHFYPTDEYIARAVDNDGVKMFLEDTEWKKPVYIITGFMCVEGAKLSNVHSRNNAVSAKAGVTDPHTGTSVGAGFAISRKKTWSTSFDGSSPFVLGIRVCKIRWNKKRVRKGGGEPYVVGAALGEGTRKQRNILDGMEYETDEVYDVASGKQFAEEIQPGDENSTVWVLP